MHKNLYVVNWNSRGRQKKDGRINHTCVKRIHHHDAYQNGVGKDECGVYHVLIKGQCCVVRNMLLTINNDMNQIRNMIV